MTAKEHYDTRLGIVYSLDGERLFYKNVSAN